ncbi:hypothetical protein AMR72_16385 [Flavobacterium psychrophilum]|nr:hypothetical protein AMR72_16385 [Flavobacterium psychrophilum]AOE53942.1 hypothetical protein ALW18_16375 [Flavobacterium psychrophilum]
MEKYIVAFKYNGLLSLSEDEEQAVIEAPITLLPMLQQGDFEFLSINHLFPSERTEHSYYDPTGSRTWTIVEVKLLLTDEEANDTEALLQKVTDDLMQQKLILERIDEELLSDEILEQAHLIAGEQEELLEDTEVEDIDTISQTIITFSHRDRNRRYLVQLKYEGQLEAVEQNASDDHIIKELTMHMQSGDTVALVTYELTHADEIDNHSDQDGSNENATYFEIRLLVNEFAVDLHDLESVYYYIIGQLSHCNAEITHKYYCGEAPLLKTVIGIDLHCDFQSIEFDDSDDLTQQL